MTMNPENLNLDKEQQAAYDDAWKALQSTATFLAPIPTVVSLVEKLPSTTENNNNNNNLNDSASSGLIELTSSGSNASHGLLYEQAMPVTLVTPTRGHHALFRALEDLEGLEKEEQTLYEHADLTRQLTEQITGACYSTAVQALQSLHAAGQAVPRRVCQHPFRKNDIVWVCRTCQADETCVLCHACYSQSNHEGHDVAFYHAQAGGCCDCGDPDAWDPAGFCPHHGPPSGSSSNSSDGNTSLPSDLVHRVRGVVPATIDWMVHAIASNAEAAYKRARPVRKIKKGLREMASNVAVGGAVGVVGTNGGGVGSSTSDGSRSMPHRSVSVPFGSGGGSSEVQDMEVDDLDMNDDNDTVDNDNDDDHDNDNNDDSDTETDDHNLMSLTDSMRVTRAHVFSPSAASAAKAERDEFSKRQDDQALKLGLTGQAGHGLYLVLHADDIHSSAQLFDALREFLGPSNYYTDSLLGKLVRALRQYGQLVIWGTMEVAAEVGATQVNLWQDGDRVASTRIGAVLLDRASRLAKHGMFCSIVTRNELMLEQRAVAVLQWLSAVARSCDPLCQTVAECILPNRHLVPLLRADFKMSARVTKAWYSLLLTLLAVPTFKSHLAAAYCDTYRGVTAKYARGMGVMERSGFTLSVQFLNRVTYVVDLVQGRDLMGKLGKSLLETLLVASRSQHLNGRLNPNHFVLTHRRYSPCISDLKCVLNVKGMPRLFACKGGTFLEDWISVLGASQFMDPQSWRHWVHGHVEDESRGWVGAFNASISLGSLFERLLGWEDDEPSPIDDPSSPLSRDLMPCVELTCHILVRGIAPWQRSEMLFYDATPYTASVEPHKRCPASLPMSTVASKHGAALAMRQLPVSQVTPFSFHLPLHRFVSCCLRELCLRKDDSRGGMTTLMHGLRTQLTEKEQDELFRGLMEFPVLVLTRAAQVRAGLWRRNGPGLNDQVLNYSEPPFCRNMRDSDLLMVQFAVLGRTLHLSPQSRPESDVGMSFLVNLLLHRLGIFDFAGFAKAPNSDINRYVEESEMKLYPREPKAADASDDDLCLPWAYSPARDTAASLVLVEEFLHMMIVFASELPSVAPVDKEDHTGQAKSRLYREVVHRLASGPKQHSELSEVHHVLSHWDNVLLSEEGKMVNPDDATGAALESVLSDVADRKLSRGKLEPDKWEMKRSSWEYYDPSFFHISLRSHQSAAETRPKASPDATSPFGWHLKPYGPTLRPAHPFFQRLRRDATSDATVVAMVYRVLHLHCRENTEKDLSDLRGNSAYESSEKSETALARVVHLLTLGAFAWEDADAGDKGWRERGGGSVGSIFFDRADDKPAPDASDWVSAVLLAKPDKVMDCDWYDGEESALMLLRRIAVDGGVSGGFVAQDAAIRSGAAWLCDFAVKMCSEADALISPTKAATEDTIEEEKAESDMEKRKRVAKEKAMANMKAQAAKFAFMMDVELGESEDEVARPTSDNVDSAPSTPNRLARGVSMTSTHSSASSVTSQGEGQAGSVPAFMPLTPDGGVDQPAIPSRLLKVRPRCIICNDEESPTEARALESDDGEGQRKKSRRRTESALGFVGYVQASTVLKGGGGPPPDLDSPMSPAREFVGTHTALCGHAVHSECCESYLATVSHREDRAIGKRDEFRCPLCQRLSNCLVPFIDVGVDWIDSPTCLPVGTGKAMSEAAAEGGKPVPLHAFLSTTPWWMARQNDSVLWDGQSAFIDKSTTSSSESLDDVSVAQRPVGKRSARSLRKKDVYAAWNAMMKTPRFVRRKLRPRGSRLTEEIASAGREHDLAQLTEGEDSSGETIVWRRFMDQISDTSYRADSKRLGDEHLHDLFGEFRHYVVEKYAYNTANRFTGSEPVDWPSCMFSEALSDTRKQEMSREKLLSKLLVTIQSFTYSCSCEAFEAKRSYRKMMSSSKEAAGARQDQNTDSMLSKFGIEGVVCDGKLVVMARPSSEEDDGSQPFNGRLGRLRYLGLSVIAAAGAVAADLIQLTLSLPLQEKEPDPSAMDVDKPERAPVAYPILFGNILTHLVAAMCATCGRSRARSDSLELVWPAPFSGRGSFVSQGDLWNQNGVESVIEDCEGFLRLGLLARILQVLLGGMQAPLCGFQNPRAVVAELRGLHSSLESEPPTDENKWMRCCVKLLDIALSNQADAPLAGDVVLPDAVSVDKFQSACYSTSSAACSFLADAGTVMQVLVPGITANRGSSGLKMGKVNDISSYSTFEKLRDFFKFEPVEEMLESSLVREVVANWYDSACRHSQAALESDGSAPPAKSIRSRLYRTQGFRVFDWPSAGSSDPLDFKVGSLKAGVKVAAADPQHSVSTSMQVESVRSPTTQSSTAEVVREQANPALVTFASKKVVPLLGGFSADTLPSKSGARPRVAVIPTSYTDLYAELGALLPDCDQTAVCLVCGEVLNANGKGECTRHSYKCGAGAGMFFLLQECSGLIMHKSKAAYIHSPYVDSHGETPQYRGRPLNLDLDRYEHLREVWYGHAVRQQVVAERGSSRQVILPDFY